MLSSIDSIKVGSVLSKRDSYSVVDHVRHAAIVGRRTQTQSFVNLWVKVNCRALWKAHFSKYDVTTL